MPVIGNAASLTVLLRPDAIQAAIKSRGASAVLQLLFEDDKRWPKVFAYIGSGSPDWLNVAVALHPASDGASAEDLRDAVFVAMKPAPRLVLGLLKDNLYWDACEPGLVDYSDRKIEKMITARIRIFETVSDPDLRTVRDKCLVDLRRELAEMRRHPGN
jgi:hypothetical protein